MAAAVDRAAIEDRVSDTRLIVTGILLAFLVLALISSGFVARALQTQVEQFLAAARRLAGGDFDHQVPVVGNDQFAQLGREFNRMSDQVRVQIDEVERRRRQAERTIRRVGTAFASGLDSQAVIDLSVQTAVEACAAEVGFGVPFAHEVFRAVTHGDVDAHRCAPAPRAGGGAGSAGVDPGTGRELMADPAAVGEVLQRAPRAVEVDGVHALAQSLRARLDTGGTPEFVGVISVARRSAPFSDGRRRAAGVPGRPGGDLAGERALHQTAQEEALTDELTGLSNVREMQRALDRELERGHRFDEPVAFVILDLDDFKQINDAYGHQQGDRVLVEAATVLRRLSRDIDEPARYGGEELAVVLAQTDLDGALHAAERMRAAIEALRIPRVDGDPAPVTVTASFGVASVMAGAEDKRSLVAAADAALYRAKRAGKNRVEAAAPAAPTRS